MKEIRDVKTRESLAVVLYALKFKEPSTEAIRVGKGFLFFNADDKTYLVY